MKTFLKTLFQSKKDRKEELIWIQASAWAEKGEWVLDEKWVLRNFTKDDWLRLWKLGCPGTPELFHYTITNGALWECFEPITDISVAMLFPLQRLNREWSNYRGDIAGTVTRALNEIEHYQNNPQCQQLYNSEMVRHHYFPTSSMEPRYQASRNW